MAYKSNISQIVKKLQRMESQTIAVCEKGIRNGLRAYESRIIVNELSGRRGNKGLNRQHGNLANSWNVDTNRESRNVIGTLSTRSKYARIHQFGGVIVPKRKKFLKFEIDKKTIFTKKVTMPKRLYILENYKKYGGKLIIMELAKSLRLAFGRK